MPATVECVIRAADGVFLVRDVSADTAVAQQGAANVVPAAVLDIDAGAGPGSYAVSLGHSGRAEIREAVRRVREEILYASADDTMAAWGESRGPGAVPRPVLTAS